VKFLIVVQARMGSTRLPGKVMLPVAGAPMLERMIQRVRHARHASQVVVATTCDPADEAIAGLAREIDVDCYRGAPFDLLDRHCRCARALGADVVVKIPSDCPLIDPAVIDRVLGFYAENQARYDFVSNLHPASYPDGNDVEAMSMAALEAAWREASLPHEREHTTPFLWDQPERFRIGNVAWETGLDLSMSHRFTVDYPEDYAFVAAIYEELYDPFQPPFTLADIFELLGRRKDLLSINSFHAGVNWYRHHLGRLRTITRAETRNPRGEASRLEP
jgi:spore coat polysaccharide biosynthesis protein SpsF